MIPKEFYYAHKDWKALNTQNRDYAFFSIHPSLMKEAKSPKEFYPLPWDPKKIVYHPSPDEWAKWEKII